MGDLNFLELKFFYRLKIISNERSAMLQQGDSDFMLKGSNVTVFSSVPAGLSAALPVNMVWR